MQSLADFILLHCLYDVYAREGYDRAVLICDRTFMSRFRFHRTFDWGVYI